MSREVPKSSGRLEMVQRLEQDDGGNNMERRLLSVDRQEHHWYRRVLPRHGQLP